MSDEDKAIMIHGAFLMLFTAATGPMPWWGLGFYGAGIFLAKMMGFR